MPATETPDVDAPATPPRPVLSPPGGDLPYEHAAAPWYAQRRAYRLIVLLLALNVVALTSITWGPITVRAWQEARAARRAEAAQAEAAAQQARAAAAKALADQQALAARQAQVRQCLAFAAPAGQVVYTEDPAEAAAMLLDGRASMSAIVSMRDRPAVRLPHPPVRWDGPDELRAALYETHAGPGGLLFMHERRTPSGRPRLVWSWVVATRELSDYSSYDGDRFVVVLPTRAVHTHVIDPEEASPRQPPPLWRHELSVVQPQSRRTRVLAAAPDGTVPVGGARVVDPGDCIRLLAGQPDPADASRFTIPYTFDGKPGAIEFRLQDDDRLRVELDRGAKTVTQFDRSRGAESWDPNLSAPPSGDAPRAR